MITSEKINQSLEFLKSLDPDLEAKEDVENLRATEEIVAAYPQQKEKLIGEFALVMIEFPESGMMTMEELIELYKEKTSGI